MIPDSTTWRDRPRPAPRDAVLMYDAATRTARLVSTAIVVREGEKWSAEQYDCMTHIEIPAHAEWIAARGVFAWTVPHDSVDRRCSACASGAPCVCRVEVAPDAGHLIAAHVAPDA
jgi:hypothetical protein